MPVGIRLQAGAHTVTGWTRTVADWTPTVTGWIPTVAGLLPRLVNLDGLDAEGKEVAYEDTLTLLL